MRILFIPDTQVRPGVNTDHLEAAGNYAVAKKPDVIVMIGDWWDMPSLNSYENRSSSYFHDKSYVSDIESGKEAMERFLGPINRYNTMRKKNKKRAYSPRMVFTEGNHEYRIQRAIKEDPRLKGTIGREDFELEKMGWEFYPFLKIVEIEDILYSHYFVNPDSLTNNPVGGTIENKLKLIGHSFAQGHQQKRQYGNRFTATGKELHGLVCGAFYSHHEDYLGEQGDRQYWRGMLLKNEVKNGTYDPCFLSLDYLIKKWL